MPFLAQRQALAAFDDAVLARALQGSEETAAEEVRKRSAAADVQPSVERTPPPPSAPIHHPNPSPTPAKITLYHGRTSSMIAYPFVACRRAPKCPS